MSKRDFRSLFIGLLIGTALVLLITVLVGCAQPAGNLDTFDPEVAEKYTSVIVKYQLYRVIDMEAGVACWFSDGSDGGVSCLPLSETWLDYERR
jgi:hypothetical protein